MCSYMYVHSLRLFTSTLSRISVLFFCIFSFKVFCEGTREYNSSFRTSKQVVEAVSARRSVIRKDELKPGTKYIVYVKATTVKGDGARSDPVVLHTPSKGMHNELVFIDMKCTHFLVPCSMETVVLGHYLKG